MNTFSTLLGCITYAQHCFGEQREGHSVKAAPIEIMGDFGPRGGGDGVITLLPALSCLHVADKTLKPGISHTPVSSSACGDQHAFTSQALNTEESKVCHLNLY